MQSVPPLFLLEGGRVEGATKFRNKMWVLGYEEKSLWVAINL